MMVTLNGNQYDLATMKARGYGWPQELFNLLGDLDVEMTGFGANFLLGNPFHGTSSTNVEIGTGNKQFTISETYKRFSPGQSIHMFGDSDHHMWGWAVSYVGNVLTVDVQNATGSGTWNNWNVNVVGIPADGFTNKAEMSISPNILTDAGFDTFPALFDLGVGGGIPGYGQTISGATGTVGKHDLDHVWLGGSGQNGYPNDPGPLNPYVGGGSNPTACCLEFDLTLAANGKFLLLLPWREPGAWGGGTATSVYFQATVLYCILSADPGIQIQPAFQTVGHGQLVSNVGEWSTFYSASQQLRSRWGIQFTGEGSVKCAFALPYYGQGRHDTHVFTEAS